MTVTGVEGSHLDALCADMSSYMQMHFGRSINILNLLPVVKKVEFGSREDTMTREKHT